MFKVSVTLTGDAQAESQLKEIRNSLEGFEPEWAKVGPLLMEYFTNEVFDSQGGVLHAPWASLSPIYAAWKAKHYGAQQILVATGALRAGYKLYTSTDSLIIRNEATSKDGQYYGAFHQNGTGKMPQRKMMDFDNDLLSKIRDIIVESVNERIAQAVG